METLKALYDSEINFKLETFWDSGVDWELGDRLNGVKARGLADSIDEAVEELAAAARVHFPASVFSRAVAG